MGGFGWSQMAMIAALTAMQTEGSMNHLRNQPLDGHFGEDALRLWSCH